MIDLDPILERVKAGDPVGAAYRLAQILGTDGAGRAFYEAGSIALSRRDDLGEDALRFARIAFGEAVERDPEHGEAHHDLATTMRELGMSEDAVRHYKRALDLMPDDADSLIGLGAAQCDAGRLDDAIKSLGRAAEAHPENGRAFANLGVALEAVGRDAEAGSAYAKAVARFDAELTEAKDDEAAGEAAARRRWARIQHAELLERMERWPQAIVEFRRLYEEEQALAEAEQAAEEAAEDDEGEGDADDPDDAGEAGEGKAAAHLADAPAPPPDPGAGETLLDDPAEGDGPESSRGSRGGDDGHDDDVRVAGGRDDDGDDDDDSEDDGDEHEHEHEHDDDDDEEDDAGRTGLERLFARLVQGRRLDLAYVVLDDLGGELADERTRATYAIYDAGDGLGTIMVQHWDGGVREKLDPGR